MAFIGRSPEECQVEECAHRCDLRHGDALLSPIGEVIAGCVNPTKEVVNENFVGTKYYSKAKSSIAGEMCIGDRVASDQQYTGNYECHCAPGFTGKPVKTCQLPDPLLLY